MEANEAPEKIYLNWVNYPLEEMQVEYTRTDAFVEKACSILKDISCPFEIIEQFKNRIIGLCDAYKIILSFLDTLEVKEIDNVWNNASDFPKAEAGRSILLIEDNGHAELLKSPSAERLFYFRPTNLKMWAYVDELLSITAHFEVKKVDYGIEVHKYAQEHFNVYDDVLEGMTE